MTFKMPRSLFQGCSTYIAVAVAVAVAVVDVIVIAIVVVVVVAREFNLTNIGVVSICAFTTFAAPRAQLNGKTRQAIEQPIVLGFCQLETRRAGEQGAERTRERTGAAEGKPAGTARCEGEGETEGCKEPAVERENQCAHTEDRRKTEESASEGAGRV